MDSAIILIQLICVIVVVLLAWAFFNGLYERRSFNGALESFKEMLKNIPYILAGLAIAFIVLCFIGMFISK